MKNLSDGYGNCCPPSQVFSARFLNVIAQLEFNGVGV